MCAWSNPVTLQVGRLELVFPAQPQHRGQWTQPGSWRPPRVGPQAGAWSAKERQWRRAFGPREQHVQEASRCSRGWSVGSRRAAQPGRGQWLHQRSSLQIEAQRGKRWPRSTGKFMAEPMDSPAGTCLPGCPLLTGCTIISLAYCPPTHLLLSRQCWSFWKEVTGHWPLSTLPSPAPGSWPQLGLPQFHRLPLKCLPLQEFLRSPGP